MTATAGERQRNQMTFATKLYVAAVIAAGGLTLAVSVPRDVPQPWLALTFLAAMLTVSLFKLRLPLGHGNSTMSMAYVVDFMVLTTASVDLAMVIAAIGALVQCTVNVRRKQPWYRAAFSVASVVLAVKAAGLTWQALGGSLGTPDTLTNVVALGAAAVLYFVVNTGLVVGAIALSTGRPMVGSWQRSFIRTAPACLTAAAIIGSLQLVARPQVYMVLPAAAVPVIIVHLAYAAWFRALNEQQRTSTA